MWRGARVPGEFPTLGYVVADFIESTCVIPDGDRQGDPFLLTDEQLRFVLWFYRLDDGGKFRFRRGLLVRPQKWGKGPFSAAMAIAEAAGPVLFDGWDSSGEPVGRPWATPWIQVTAVSEDQTDNVWRALQPMIELGPLKADIPDTGLSRINLAGGGMIEPVTSSASSRLGQRITFAVQDEALALDTPLPTPTGWTTAGEVRVGDALIGSDGLPTEVLGVTDIRVDRQCYRVTFQDGTSVIASDGHLWQTKVAGSAAKPRIRTTGEMVRDGRTFRIPAPQPWQLPHKSLPVDPYFLGLWLGDGSTGQPHITAGDEDVDELRRLLADVGVQTKAHKSPEKAWRVGFSSRAGFQGDDRPEVAKALRSMPCFTDKHIPDDYLRASVEQRTALLQGLMDSDGHITADGHCTFVGNERLASDVLSLLRTLGQVARKVFRSDERSRDGGSWKVNFCPRGDLIPFRLPRKAERVRPAKRGPEWVTIADIQGVHVRPVRCVKVAAPNHLFLAGEGCHVTHNTHDWRPENKMRKLADTQRRNLAGMGGRSVETTNAWDPAEKSVAQMTYEQALSDVHLDYREPPKGLTFATKRERSKIFRHVYGDSWWVDPDRIEAEYVELSIHDEAQAQRFFGNAIVAGQGAAVDPEQWARLRKPREVPRGTRIGLGFDGSISDDETVLRACTVDGYSWTVHRQARPSRGKDWRVNRLAVYEAIAEAFDYFDVGRFFYDPPKWWTEGESWADEFGDEIVLAFDTNQDRRMAPAVDRWLTAINLGEHTHDGDVTAHVLAAQKKKARAKDPEDDSRTLYVLQKPGDGRKIDGAVADVLAFEAAMSMDPEPAEVDVQVMFV